MIAVALRAPTAPESFALSVASTALAIILAGVVLILIADAVDLSPAINRWPLVTLGVVIVAVAAVSLTAGQRSRAENLARDLTAPWASAGRLEALEQKVEALLAEEQVRPEGVRTRRELPLLGGVTQKEEWPLGTATQGKDWEDWVLTFSREPELVSSPFRVAAPRSQVAPELRLPSCAHPGR